MWGCFRMPIRFEPTSYSPLSCERCRVQPHCAVVQIAVQGGAAVASTLRVRRTYREGEGLYAQGDACSEVHVIRTGAFKLQRGLECGREQVLGFQYSGGLLGLDALWTGQSPTTIAALMDSETCSIHLNPDAGPNRATALLLRHASQAIRAQQSIQILLGQMRAEERVAQFLLTHARTMRDLGFSGREFVLPMSWADIGSYLAVRHETVGRALKAFAAAGLVQARRRHIKLIDPNGLRNLVAWQD